MAGTDCSEDADIAAHGIEYGSFSQLTCSVASNPLRPAGHLDAATLSIRAEDQPNSVWISQISDRPIVEEWKDERGPGTQISPAIREKRVCGNSHHPFLPAEAFIAASKSQESRSAICRTHQIQRHGAQSETDSNGPCHWTSYLENQQILRLGEATELARSIISRPESPHFNDQRQFLRDLRENETHFSTRKPQTSPTGGLSPLNKALAPNFLGLPLNPSRELSTSLSLTPFPHSLAPGSSERPKTYWTIPLGASLDPGSCHTKNRTPRLTNFATNMLSSIDLGKGKGMSTWSDMSRRRSKV